MCTHLLTKSVSELLANFVVGPSVGFRGALDNTFGTILTGSEQSRLKADESGRKHRNSGEI